MDSFCKGSTLHYQMQLYYSICPVVTTVEFHTTKCCYNAKLTLWNEESCFANRHTSRHTSRHTPEWADTKKHTLTSCASCRHWRRNWGRWSRDEIQRCAKTCGNVILCCGSTCNILETKSFASVDTVSQLPPDNTNLPSPIRARISPGVSFGLVANGVCLQVLLTCH